MRASRGAGEGARGAIRRDGRCDGIARGWPQGRAEVLVIRHGDRLGVVRGVLAEVKDGQRRKRAARQRESRLHAKATVAAAVLLHKLEGAVWLLVHRRAHARAARRVARQPQRSGQGLARAAARRCRARSVQRGTEADGVVARQVDLSELAVDDEAVGIYVIRPVARGVGDLQIKVDGAIGLQPMTIHH